eukprot:161722-Hanusia_phi.AAC.4
MRICAKVSASGVSAHRWHRETAYSPPPCSCLLAPPPAPPVLCELLVSNCDASDACKPAGPDELCSCPCLAAMTTEREKHFSAPSPWIKNMQAKGLDA